MAIGVTRVNGAALPAELFGRDLDWVLIASTGIDTTYTAVNSNLELAVRTVENYGTVSVIGTPASGNVRLVVEGLSANATVLATALALVITGNTPVVTVSAGMSGATFA